MTSCMPKFLVIHLLLTSVRNEITVDIQERTIITKLNENSLNELTNYVKLIGLTDKILNKTNKDEDVTTNKKDSTNTEIVKMEETTNIERIMP